MSRVALRTVASAAVLVALAACHAPPAPASPRAAVASNLRELPARPPLAVVLRNGDPRGALSVAVMTSGVDDAAGPRVPVALAAVIEARLLARGIHDATVAATWDGYRVRALLPATPGALALVHAIREAMLTPITAGDTAVMEVVDRRVAALSRRPLRDPALEDAARCGEEPFATDRIDQASWATVEAWRAASHGLGRVVIAAAGTGERVDDVASALLREPAWPLLPAAAPRVALTSLAGARPDAAAPQVRVYDGSPEVPAGTVRASIVVLARDARVAMSAAESLGAADGPLLGRLAGLEPGITATVHDVTATLGAAGGCLALTLLLRPPHNAGSLEDDGRIADVLAMVRQEVRLSLANAAVESMTPAQRAGDPREAAELAAWWALMVTRPRRESSALLHETIAVGLGAAGDKSGELQARAETLRAAIGRADEAWERKVVESSVSVETGQGAFWILLASPCGTAAEGDVDAGLTALAVTALATDAQGRAATADVSEWIASDGAGILVRATKRDGESGTALARRAADIAGSAMAAASLDGGDIGRARATLLDRLGRDDEARGFATLAAALNPGHAAWDFPLGNGRALESWPDGTVTSRAAALRRGPLRVAVLANEDAGQAAIAVKAIDRWVPHAGDRACAPTSAPTPPKPGTYATPSQSTHDAWLAFPLTHPDTATRDAAQAVAAALDGDNGLLATSLSLGLASSWGARVVGPANASALVVRVGSSGLALDAAVAQVRVLFDRMRQGSFTEANRTHAMAVLGERALATSLDPRGRLIRLWRGEPAAPTVPPLDALVAFLAETFHDDALVIVAARPPTPGKPPP